MLQVCIFLHQYLHDGRPNNVLAMPMSRDSLNVVMIRIYIDSPIDYIRVTVLFFMLNFLPIILFPYSHDLYLLFSQSFPIILNMVPIILHICQNDIIKLRIHEFLESNSNVTNSRLYRDS